MTEEINLSKIDNKWESEAYKILPSTLRHKATEFSEKSVEAYKTLNANKKVELSDVEKVNLAISITKQTQIDGLNALLNANLADKTNLTLASLFAEKSQVQALPIAVKCGHLAESALKFTAAAKKWYTLNLLETNQWKALNLCAHPKLAMEIDDSQKLEAYKLLSNEHKELAPNFDTADHNRALKATLKNPQEALKFMKLTEKSQSSEKKFQFKAFELKPIADKAIEVTNQHAFDIYSFKVIEEKSAPAQGTLEVQAPVQQKAQAQAEQPVKQDVAPQAIPMATIDIKANAQPIEAAAQTTPTVEHIASAAASENSAEKSIPTANKDAETLNSGNIPASQQEQEHEPVAVVTPAEDTPLQPTLPLHDAEQQPLPIVQLVEPKVEL